MGVTNVYVLLVICVQTASQEHILSIDSFIHPVTRLFLQSSFRPLTILIQFVHPFHHPSTCIRVSSHLFFHTHMYMYVYISIIFLPVRVCCVCFCLYVFQFQLQLQLHLHLHFAFTGAVTCASACVFEVFFCLMRVSRQAGEGAEAHALWPSVQGRAVCALS